MELYTKEPLKTTNMKDKVLWPPGTVLYYPDNSKEEYLLKEPSPTPPEKSMKDKSPKTDIETEKEYKKPPTEPLFSKDNS